MNSVIHKSTEFEVLASPDAACIQLEPHQGMLSFPEIVNC